MRRDYCDSCGDEVGGSILNLAARTATGIRGEADFFLKLDLCQPCANNVKQAILNIPKVIMARGLQGSAKE